MIDLESFFEEHNEEYLKFELVEEKPCQMPDVCAFLLMNSIAPLKPGRDAVTAAAHDIFYLAFDAAQIAENVTKPQLIDMIRCGVMYESEHECFSMFT